MDSPGHIRTCLVPPPCSQGWLGRTLLSPSLHSQCFGIVSPPNTHRCRNLENFHATEMLFPEQGCEFLLGQGGLTLLGHATLQAASAKLEGQTGSSLVSSMAIGSSIPNDPTAHQWSTVQVLREGTASPTPSPGTQGQISRWQAMGVVPWAMKWLQQQETAVTVAGWPLEEADRLQQRRG